MRLVALAFIASVQALRLPPRLVAPRQKFKTSLLAEAEAAAPPAEAPKEDEGASVAASTVNLVKSIVGAGVLALPAGVAAFSDAGPALWPATALITALGAASAYSFGVLGRVCGAYDAETYKDAWARSVGEKSAWVVTLCCTLTPFLACLAYSIIMGDAAASLIAAANPGPRVCSALNACGGARRGSIAALTVGALWPLCSLKSLAALAPTSALGTAGVVYTAGFMAKRALDGTYKAGATFVKSLSRDLAPKFGSTLVKPGLGLGVFVAMCGTAYMAHFNAPNFFVDAGKDEKKYATVVRRGFALSVLLNVAVMVAGYLTFGASSQGLVLNNYAVKDSLASVARLLFGVSTVFTFPLAYAAVKVGVRGVLPKLSEKAVVAAPLGLITAIALLLDDVGVVVSLTGALMGSAVIYALPAVMLLKGDKVEKAAWEKKLAPYGMLGLSAVSAVLGTLATFA